MKKEKKRPSPYEKWSPRGGFLTPTQIEILMKIHSIKYEKNSF